MPHAYQIHKQDGAYFRTLTTVEAKNSDLSKIMRDFKKFTSGTLINEIRFGTESRKAWLLKIFEEGGEKQTIKSAHQLWPPLGGIFERRPFVWEGIPPSGYFILIFFITI